MPFTDYYPRPDLYQANYGQPVPALPSAPAFDLRAALYTGQWNDITPFIYQRDTVHIQRGRQNEASTMQPSTATFTLNNRDGRFTTRNPAGAYFPNLVQNTPVRLSMPAGAAGLPNYLRLETDAASRALTADKAALQITGPIDIRVDLWPSDYSGNILAAKWGATARSWMLVFDQINWDWPFTANTPPWGIPVATGTSGSTGSTAATCSGCSATPSCPITGRG